MRSADEALILAPRGVNERLVERLLLLAELLLLRVETVLSRRAQTVVPDAQPAQVVPSEPQGEVPPP